MSLCTHYLSEHHQHMQKTMSTTLPYLKTAQGKDGFAGTVHEDDLPRTPAIAVDSVDYVPARVNHREAVAADQERLPPHREGYAGLFGDILVVGFSDPVPILVRDRLEQGREAFVFWLELLLFVDGS